LALRQRSLVLRGRLSPTIALRSSLSDAALVLHGPARARLTRWPTACSGKHPLTACVSGDILVRSLVVRGFQLFWRPWMNLIRCGATLVVSAVTLVSSQVLHGQEVKAGGTGTIVLRGFVSASFFAQDALFGLGNGQKAQFVQEDLEEDEWWHGGDARSTRLTLAFEGAKVTGEWRPNAVAEIDFFGPFASSGNFGDEQPLPRLRLAYGELTNGRTTLRLGQDWALTWGNVPVSTSHLGSPLGWGTGGFIGWRFLGAQLHHTLTRADAPITVQLKLGVFKGSWSDEPGAVPGAVPAEDDGPSAGEAGTPQLEARLDLGGRIAETGNWALYLAGHYDRKDLDGAGVDFPTTSDLESWAVEAGARLAPTRFTLHGNAYYGRAMGHHFGNIIQFRDVEGWGAWVQAGFNVTSRWSVWGFAGTDDPDDTDDEGLPLARKNSVQLVPMLRYQTGPLAFGLEWLHSKTEWFEAPVQRTGNQIILSALYAF
jgi:hypothetical protein